MIIRLNQFDPADAERYAGWHGEAEGEGRFRWPPDAYGLELVVRDIDEQDRAVPPAARQNHLRRMIPRIAQALSPAGQKWVARLDGPLVAGELPAALDHLTDARGRGRYAVSPVRRFDAEVRPTDVPASIRIEVDSDRLVELCADPRLGLASRVRLRLVSVDPSLVDPLLDIDSTAEDERWPEVISQAGVVIGTCRGLFALQCVTLHGDATVLRRQLVDLLSASNGSMVG